MTYSQNDLSYGWEKQQWGAFWSKAVGLSGKNYTQYQLVNKLATGWHNIDTFFIFFTWNWDF